MLNQPLYDAAKRVMAGNGSDWDQALIAARNDGGFHWRDDIYFKRLPGGAVRLRRFGQENGCANWADVEIPASEWASIVASVSAGGETGNAWEAALTFHNRASHPPQAPGRPVPRHGSGPDNQ